MRENEAKFNAWMSKTISLAEAHEDFLEYGDLAAMPVSADHLNRAGMAQASGLGA